MTETPICEPTLMCSFCLVRGRSGCLHARCLHARRGVTGKLDLFLDLDLGRYQECGCHSVTTFPMDDTRTRTTGESGCRKVKE